VLHIEYATTVDLGSGIELAVGQQALQPSAASAIMSLPEAQWLEA
jgi:hypothetical protein